MSNICAVSSTFIKNSIPLLAISKNYPKISSFRQTLIAISCKPISLPFISNKIIFDRRVLLMGTKNPDVPPEIQTTTPPEVTPGVPTELPRVPNVPDFDPIPPEKPAERPPISPGPVPEFPGPPDPSTPRPESPKPPSPSPPGTPEVFPPRGPEIDTPHGPEIMPPKPPEPEPPHPLQPDIPPPVSM